MTTWDFHFQSDLVNCFNSAKSLKRNGTSKTTIPFVGLTRRTKPRKNPATAAFLCVK